MKISELVNKLEKVKADYGDIAIVHRDFYEDRLHKIDRLVILDPSQENQYWARIQTLPAYLVELI